jgi:predicted nucleotide-binding protein
MAADVGNRNRPYPAHNLEKALQIIQAIADSGASRPMDRLLVAEAIKRTPSSSEFRQLLSSSLKYGLTDGTEKASEIKPTPLGLQVIKPVSETERKQALLRAALNPTLLNQIFSHFNKQKLPRIDFLRNVLNRQFSVDNSHTEDLANLITENAKFVGVLQQIGGSDYLNLDLVKTNIAQRASESEVNVIENNVDETPGETNEQPKELETRLQERRMEKPKKIFVAHGKKQGPLKEVQAILTKFKIPFVVAGEEPHAGRPISTKVAETMQQCSAGLYIFTKDEEFQDKKGTAVWRPSENVVFELGAGSMMWGKKIIILKEEGVNFASDYQDLGYITFQEGQLSSIGMHLFMELIAFDFIKVEAA